MHSIRSYLAFRLLVAFVLLLSVASFLIYLISKRILEADFDARLFAKAQAVVASTSQKGDKLDVDWANLPQEFGALGKPANLIEILDSNDRQLAGDSFLSGGITPAPESKAFTNSTSIRGEKIRVLTFSFLPSVEEEDATATPSNIRKKCLLVVGSDRTQLDHSLNLTAEVLATTTGLTSLFSLGIVIFFLRLGLRPLASLSLEVSQINESSLERRIDLSTLPIEVVPIAEKLNELLQRLEISFARERRFSADISHELRTPVAELRTLAEIMLKQPNLSSETHQAFQDVLDSSRQMEVMVAALLEIVRGENSTIALEVQSISLSELLTDCWKPYSAQAQAKNLKCTANLPDGVRVTSDPRLLRLALNNLFSNAVEYTPLGGVIETVLEHSGCITVISIQNSSEDVSAEDLPHFFERFWRKDRVRGNTAHMGLGLSLAQVICQRLQIQMTVSLPTPNRVCFWLGIPHLLRHQMKPFVFLLLVVSGGLVSDLLADVSTPTVQTRTLDQLVAEVLANNPELKGTEADVAAAKGIRVQSGMWKNPDISGMGAYRRVTNPGTVNTGYSDQFSVTQTFEFPGKATLRKAIADQDVTLAEIGLTQFRSALAGRVKLLAYRYALAEQNRAAADLVIARSRALVALLDKRPKAGLQAMFDSGILEGNLEDLAVTQHDFALEAVTSLSELNSLRGWPSTTPLEVILPGKLTSLPTSLDHLLVSSLSSSPILLMKEIELKKAQLQVKASKLDTAPDFAIGPFYSLDNAGDHDQKFGASVTFSLPVWNQNQGNIAASKAALLKTETTQEQARRDLDLSITKIYQSRQLLDSQISQTKPELLQNLAQLADMADRQYRLGAINLTTFLEVQRQYLGTMRSVHQTTLDANSLNLDLQLLTGTMAQVSRDEGGKP